MPAINQRIYDWIDESLKGRNIPFPEEDRNDNTPLFFHLLHYDIRKTIYDMLLTGVGTRHHVTDSGPQRARPLMAVKCDDWLFERSFTCGHKSCEAARRGRAEIPEELVASQDIWIPNNESKDRLENLVSFMKTCKTAHEDVSEYIYRSLTFVFNDFWGLKQFIDQASERNLAQIRRIGFIINVGDSKTCKDIEAMISTLTKGNGHLKLCERFPALQHLEINYFLCFQKDMPIPDLGKIAKSLSLMANKPQILFRVPKGPDVPGVPGVSNLSDGVDKETRRSFQAVPDIAEDVLQPFANMTLIRPEVTQREECLEHPRRHPSRERGRGEEGEEWTPTPREQRRQVQFLRAEPRAAPWVMPTAPPSLPTSSWSTPPAPVHGGSPPPPPPAWVEALLATRGVPAPLLDPDERNWPSSPPVPFGIVPPPAEDGPSGLFNVNQQTTAETSSQSAEAGPSLEPAAVRSSTEEATAGPSSEEAASGSSSQPAAAMSSSQLAAAWSELEIAADGPSSEVSFQPAPAR